MEYLTILLKDSMDFPKESMEFLKVFIDFRKEFIDFLTSVRSGNWGSLTSRPSIILASKLTRKNDAFVISAS